MTNDEIINRIEYAKLIVHNQTYSPETEQALDMAIQALEQPQDGDRAVSLNAVINTIFDHSQKFKNEFDRGFFIDAIRKLSSVQPKTGHWINGNYHIRCSECGEDYPYRLRNFCPNCGADMRKDGE